MTISEQTDDAIRELTGPAPHGDDDLDLPDLELAKTISDITSAFDEIFALMEVAEDEILAAQQRHGETPPVWEDGVLIRGEKGRSGARSA